MIATHSPRKDRGSSASRKRYGWGLAVLAACVACLVLVVWLFVRDAQIGKTEVRARSATENGGEPSPPISPDDLPEENPDPPVEQSALGRTTPESRDPKMDAAFSNIAKSQKTPVVSKSRDALAPRSFSIRNIEPAFVKSPTYLMANGKGKPFTPRTWLRVVVTFESASARIAELSFRYKISIGDEMFTGTMTHVEILGGGDHQVAAYVIPSVVESLLQRRDFVADKTVRVDVEALNGETVLARSQFGKMFVAPRKMRPDLLRSVEKTPFAPLEIDLFERSAD